MSLSLLKGGREFFNHLLQLLLTIIIMKRSFLQFGFIIILIALLASSCGTSVTLTSWKKPNDNSKITKLVVIGLFAKLEYIKSFEHVMSGFFSSHGINCVESITILDPGQKYTSEQIKSKVDSIGGDAVLIVEYAGTDKSQSYVPTSYYAGGYYGGYYGYGYYGANVYTGGYW